MTTPLRLTTLGGLGLAGAEGSVLSGRRFDLALLAVVASRSPMRVRREELQALFWGERGDEKARNSLRQVVLRLRRACGAVLEADANAIRMGNDGIELDAAVFASAARAGRWTDAIGAWTGEFLPQCEDIGGEEFRVWLEVERERLRNLLAECYARAVSQAESEERWTDATDAACGWSASFQLQEEASRKCIEALCRAGRVAEAEAERHGFIVRLQRELEDAPDEEWLDATERVIRSAREATAALPARVTPVPSVSHERSAAPLVLPHRPRWPQALFATAVVVAIAFVGVRVATARSGKPPRVAVGEIASSLTPDSSRGFSTLLAINLARIAALDVVTERRLSEVAVGRSDSTPNAVARAAGAREILEGVLSRRPDNTVRIDLRRVDVATGATKGAYAVEAKDLAELAELVSESVARDLGAQSPVRRADGSTTSILAYGFYEQGLRAFDEGDPMAAQRFFAAALAADSTFAMAAYYAAHVSNGNATGSYIAQALRFAPRASDRERLLISAEWARGMADPRAYTWAESLVTRYPGDPDGHVMYAQELIAHGDPAGALAHLRRVVDMDSSLAATAFHCRACDAVGSMVEVYAGMDSAAPAELASRLWLRWQPRSPRAWLTRSRALGIRGDFAAAHAAVDSAIKYATGATPLWHTVWWFAADDYEAVDRAVRDAAGSGKADLQLEALWTRVLSMRAQGRMGDALRAARQYRVVADARTDHDRPDIAALLLEGTALLDADSARRASAMFDSCAVLDLHRIAQPSRRGASRAWFWTSAAAAYAAVGDTATLRRLEDSVRVNGALGTPRHQRLHYYVRGLRLAAAGQPAAAAAAYEQAISGPQDTHVRIYLELGRALIAAGRAAEAVAPLIAGLKGPVSAAGLYATRTELEEELGRAYEQSGQRELALAQYRRVVSAWKNADPRFMRRRAFPQARVAALSRAAATPVRLQKP